VEKPFGSSIFPKVDEWLKSSEKQNALNYIGKTRYHHTIDFLFCELFPEYKKGCFDFYKEKEPLLKEILSHKELYEDIMIFSLEKAYEQFCQKSKSSWKQWRKSSFEKYLNEIKDAECYILTRKIMKTA
jgi:hypothetical protein